MTNVNTDELVLKVKPDVDPSKINIEKYEDFFDSFFGSREYLKEATREAVRFLLGEEYANTVELAKENYEKNPSLEEYYGSFNNLKNRLEFGDKLSCTIDLATATGKTWVMYAVAQILLSEGKVDQVLIICPSVTIKQQLRERFEQFSTNTHLKASLPEDSKIKNPRIIDASQTIKAGDICIENVHATYKRTSSSIEDSIEGKGTRTLVINDESHHIMNPKEEVGATERKYVKKWKEFLSDKKYSFQFIVNLSGTPYLGNNYSADVIYRYNIMQAMSGKKAGNFVIKKIDYVQKDSAINEKERFEIIYHNHQNNKKRYSKVKPITVFVTQRITGADSLSQKLKDFLMEKEGLSIKEVDKKVIVVTSSPKHEENVKILKLVDDPANKVEWIISVSMLTEGWDVKNVFEIVPHEERAFNSKLLIAQVLGRGLRVPPRYESDQPTVVVYNHAKWSSAIKDLVYEVMSYEKRVKSYPVQKEKNYNFVLHQIDYRKKEHNVKLSTATRPVTISSIPQLSSQPKIIRRETTYHKIKEDKEETIDTRITVQRYTVKQLLNDVHNKLSAFDEEEETDYAKKFNKQEMKKKVISALASIGDDSETLTEDNYNRILRSYDILKRQISGTTSIQRIAKDPYVIKTEDIGADTISISELKKDHAIIYDSSSVEKSAEEDKKLIKTAFNELPRKNVIEVNNTYHFKCPLNTVILSHSNEIEFATHITDKRYADKITAWIKSLDRGFYDIPYTYRKGTHQKEAKFNPDFFIKIDNDILVIEIKSDEDVTDVNKAKLKFAQTHFEELNTRRLKQKYYFKFLSPKDYSPFFDSLLNGTYRDYVTDLEAELSRKNGNGDR